MMPTIYACQLDTVWHDAVANRRAVEELLATKPVQAGSLIALPEMFDVGFSMDSKVATEASRETIAFAQSLAQKYKSTVIAGHASLDANGRPVNQATAIDASGNALPTYVKIQGFSPAGEVETYAGGAGTIVFEWAGLNVAPLICYDLRFPELFRAGVKLGAVVFVVIANWPIARVEHWVTLAKARAIENQAYVIAVNRCGSDPKLKYPGRSLIIDPKGEVLAEAGDGIELLSAEIDPEVVRRWRHDFPALRDARFL